MTRDVPPDFEARRRELVAARALREAELPVRLLRQTSHFTTPASDLELVKKSLLGFAGAARVLEKLGLGAADVARALEVDEALVARLLATTGGPPLVVVDSEDATALDPGVLEKARATAIAAFTQLEWGRTLAFYRPSGIELADCVPDLVSVISGTAARSAGRRFPLDGVVWPKVTHEDELAFLDDLLSHLEARCGLERRALKVSFLVESGRAVARIEKLVDAILPRLAGVIWGVADYSADVGLPVVENAHPACDLARSALVNIAGAVGVPAIDAMTFEYPVRDPGLDADSNRRKILGAMRRCFDDAKHGAYLGMEGKWVGHPLQLLANELAWKSGEDAASVERDVAAARAYIDAVEKGKGAAMIGGQMADRATDRHVRRRLRRALAQGLVSEEVARAIQIA